MSLLRIISPIYFTEPLGKVKFTKFRDIMLMKVPDEKLMNQSCDRDHQF